VPSFAQTPKSLLRFIHLPPQIAYSLGLGPLIGRLVLLLTTTGRKSGKPRVVPLQYEEADGLFLVGSSRGERADWVRNLRADPRVTVRAGRSRFAGTAEVVKDARRVADFLELRLRRHPRMVGMMMRAEGLSDIPDRTDLERYASDIALVVITPDAKKAG
jgi:deazaflavin-dependent oxidoreductase (nitroreductase family)